MPKILVRNKINPKINTRRNLNQKFRNNLTIMLDVDPHTKLQDQLFIRVLSFDMDDQLIDLFLFEREMNNLCEREAKFKWD